MITKPNPEIPRLQAQIDMLQEKLREMKIADFIRLPHPELELYLDGAFLYVILREHREKRGKMDFSIEICTQNLPYNPIGLMAMGGVRPREDVIDYIRLNAVTGEYEKKKIKVCTVQDFPIEIQRIIYEGVYEYIPAQTER